MLDIAFEIARANPTKFQKMGAVITYKGKVIAVGLNSNKSHPMQKKYGKNSKSIFLHAEIDAIKNGLRNHKKEDFKNFEIHVARCMKNGLPGMAKPCRGCQKAIDEYLFKAVHWTK